LDNLITS